MTCRARPACFLDSGMWSGGSVMSVPAPGIARAFQRVCRVLGHADVEPWGANPKRSQLEIRRLRVEIKICIYCI